MLTLSCYDSVSIVTEWCNHRNVIVTLLSEVMMINSSAQESATIDFNQNRPYRTDLEIFCFTFASQ